MSPCTELRPPLAARRTRRHASAPLHTGVARRCSLSGANRTAPTCRDRLDCAPCLSRVGIKLKCPSVRIQGIAAVPRVGVDLAESKMRSRMEWIEAQRFLVGGDSVFDVSVRCPGITEPDVRLGVKRAQADRPGVGLDRLADERAGCPEEKIAQRLEWLGHCGGEEPGSSGLGRCLPAGAARLGHGTQCGPGPYEVP